MAMVDLDPPQPSPELRPPLEIRQAEKDLHEDLLR